MDILPFVLPAFILAIFLVVMYEIELRKLQNKVKPQNKVHFYMARDKDGELYLYLGKPLRDYGEFIGDLTKGSIVLTGYHFNKFGLNKNDYAKLKWEDEPVEVFLNLED